MCSVRFCPATAAELIRFNSSHVCALTGSAALRIYSVTATAIRNPPQQIPKAVIFAGYAAVQHRADQMGQEVSVWQKWTNKPFWQNFLSVQYIPGPHIKRPCSSEFSESETSVTAPAYSLLLPRVSLTRSAYWMPMLNLTSPKSKLIAPTFCSESLLCCSHTSQEDPQWVRLQRQPNKEVTE